MRRIRWILLVCAPALILLLVRFGLVQGGARAQPATPSDARTSGDAAATRVTLPLDAAHARRAAAGTEAPAGAALAEAHAEGTDDAQDAWALPESDPRRGLVEAFRGMNDDTSPNEAELKYVAALERGGFSSEAWTHAARAAAQTWFAGLAAQVTCYAGGCAASITAADAGALADARQRVTQQAAAAAWQGPVVTAPAVAEADGRQRQMWIFVRPE